MPNHLRRAKFVAFALACALLSAALAFNVNMASAQTPAAVSAAGESAIKTLDRAQIDALLATPDKVLIIDVRRADEISTIGGFPVFLSIQNSELDRYLPYIPRDREIVTVSNHAHRAVHAGALLASKGFRVVGAAGVQDYEAQGGKLTGKKIAPPAAPAPATGVDRPGN